MTDHERSIQIITTVSRSGYLSYEVWRDGRKVASWRTLETAQAFAEGIKETGNVH